MTFNLNDKKFIDLSKIFSPTILKELSKTGKSNKLSNILIELDLIKELDLKIKLSNFFNEIYKLLSKNYRNEYIYKNYLIRKILLGRHSLNTANIINECRVNNSKADCVILNGTSTVYEIKTEYDNFSRLDNQIYDYKQAFEYIYIVIPEKSLEKLEFFLKDINIGILCLNKNNSFTKIKDAKSNLNYFNKNTIFDILRKKEYMKIIKKYYGDIPSMPNTKVYSYCKNLFLQLDMSIIHLELIKNLKKER
jgi:hypothetical protein